VEEKREGSAHVTKQARSFQQHTKDIRCAVEFPLCHPKNEKDPLVETNHKAVRSSGIFLVDLIQLLKVP
jgi:hypothetical protein